MIVSVRYFLTLTPFIKETVALCQDWPARIVEKMVNCAVEKANQQTSQQPELPVAKVNYQLLR